MPIQTKQSKLEHVRELSEQTAHDISRNAERWRDFLVTATNQYKYEFPEQLLIHAQRPDATACAELHVWSGRMNRYVNRGATGIALIDDSGDTLRLRYVFDVSDTHSAMGSKRSRAPYQWRFTDEKADSIIGALNNRYNLNSNFFAEAIQQTAEQIVKNNLDDYLNDLMLSRTDSFLEDMDRVNVRKNFRDLMINSVEYCIYTRCGYDADEYVPLENFGDVCDFNTLNTVTALGTAVSEMSEEILRQIEKSVKEYDLQKRKELYDGLHRKQPILAPTDRTGGTADIGQVRAASQAAPTETSQGNVQSTSNVRTASTVSDRDTADSGEPRGTDNREPVTENAPAAENRTDEVGTTHELNSDDGRGSDTERTDLRVEYFDRNTEDRSLPLLRNNNIIKEMLRTSPHLSESREEIAEFFASHSDFSEQMEYIRGIFNNDYTELLIGEDNDHRVGYKKYQNVLHLWEGSYTNRTSQGYYDWSIIAQYYSAMMLLDEFLDTPAVPQRAQLSLFDPEPVEVKPKAFEFNQKIIDAVLCRGNGVDGGKLQIYKQFTESLDMSENEKFLRHEYGTGGASPVIIGTSIKEWHDSSGIRLTNGDAEDKLSWRNAAKRIGELIREDKYLTKAEKAKYEHEQTEPNEGVSGQAEYEPWYDNFLQLKSEHEDELLLFKMGDFYELFGDDALHAAEVLELTLTTRDNGVEQISMCGLPQHTLEQYVDRLVQHDFKVAVTDMTAANFRSTGEYIPREVVELYSNKGIEFAQTDRDIFRQYSNRLVPLVIRDTEYLNARLNSDAENIRLECASAITRAVLNMPITGNEHFHRLYADNPQFRSQLHDHIFKMTYTDVIKSIEKAMNPTPRKRLSPEERNYRFIERFAPEILSGEARYIRFMAGASMMPLTIQQLAENRISISHTYTQDGDLIYDPDMEFVFDTDAKTLIPQTYQQDGLGIYQSVEDGNTTVGELNKFTGQWFKNISHQGYVKERQIAVFHDEDIELKYDKDKNIISINGNTALVSQYMSENNIQLPDAEPTQHDYPEITRDMYDVENADIFVIPKKNSALAEIDITASEELFQRLADSGVVRTDDSQNRILYNTDAKNWNKIVIPDKWGNLTNNIEASEFLTESEYATMLEVSRAVIAPEYRKEIEDDVSVSEQDIVAETGVPTAPMPDNFHITDMHLGAGGAKTKFRNNVEAIKTLQLIERENRYATPEEQEILSRYVGWGGISQAFDNSKPDWHNEYEELKSLLSDEEYSAARATTLSSFYTSPTVIFAIYTALSDMGFERGNVLEPSCGIGNFFGLLPNEMKQAKLYGVELDSITGRIAKQLYPHADIQITGYEKSELQDNFFDVVIGNVPFGNYKVADNKYNKLNYNIHDYFIAKSLDKVRAGGVMAFVTSSGTMDKQNPEIRRYIAQRAELLGAIRLPNNAFKENANTEVTTDILFLQKRDRLIDIEPDWVFLGKNKDDLAINQYFVDNPDMILGKIVDGNKMYGNNNGTMCVPIEGADLSE